MTHSGNISWHIQDKSQESMNFTSKVTCQLVMINQSLHFCLMFVFKLNIVVQGADISTILPFFAFLQPLTQILGN